MSKHGATAIWRWIVGLVVVAGIAFALSRVMTAKGVTVDVATGETGEMASYVEEQAKTPVPGIYEITMSLQGRIKPIELREGDHVEEGQVVARMDVDRAPQGG